MPLWARRGGEAWRHHSGRIYMLGGLSGRIIRMRRLSVSISPSSANDSDRSMPLAEAAQNTAADCDAARRWRTAAASFWRMAEVALQSMHGSVTLMP